MRKIILTLFTFSLICIGILFYTGTMPETSAAKATLSETTRNLDRGEVFTLKVTNGSGNIKWSVSNKKVGLNRTKGTKVEVTALKSGKSVVTAKVGKQTLTCNIKISKNGLNLTKKSMKSWQEFDLKLVGYGDDVDAKWKIKGKTKTFKLTDSDGMKWKLKTKPIFTHGNTGNDVTIYSQRSGKATVIAKVNGKKFKCVVTVKKRSGKRRSLNTLDCTFDYYTETKKFLDGTLVFIDKNYDIYDLDGYKTGQNIFDI